ncbi:MAG: hypothetical protein ABI775_06665 [Pseudonocardiales bacterium]
MRRGPQHQERPDRERGEQDGCEQPHGTAALARFVNRCPRIVRGRRHRAGSTDRCESDGRGIGHGSAVRRSGGTGRTHPGSADSGSANQGGGP